MPVTMLPSARAGASAPWRRDRGTGAAGDGADGRGRSVAGSAWPILPSDPELPEREEPLLERYHAAVAASVEARARAEQAERRLRARLLALTWPASLGGIAGGFAAVVALRLAGL